MSTLWDKNVVSNITNSYNESYIKKSVTIEEYVVLCTGKKKKMVEGINALFDPSDSKLELEKTGKKIKKLSRYIYIYI
jgi:hypothetical protein